MKKNCIIIDLEGTLSDHTHRVHHYENKDYDKYNEKFIDDPINAYFLEAFKNMQEVDKIILCTAKSEEYKGVVIDWLKKYNLFQWFDSIVFRKELDSRPSVLVKRNQLKEIQKKYNVICAYDDRQDTVNMYWKNGVKAFLVHPPEQKPLPNLFPADLILREHAKVFERKNKEYGSSYHHFGEIMMALFPNGLDLESTSDFNRFGILNTMVSKIDRYCKNFTKGGHSDSLTDISVYAAMLQEVDNG